MKGAFLCVVGVSIMSIVLGAEWVEITHNDNPELCISTEHPSLGKMQNNEEKTIEGCIRATCIADHGIIYSSCVIPHTNAPAKIVDGDQTKPYPECCPKVVPEHSGEA